MLISEVTVNVISDNSEGVPMRRPELPDNVKSWSLVEDKGDEMVINVELEQ